jgi:hypothetical protein
VCSDIWGNGNDIGTEGFVYNWYMMDHDKDEKVSFEDFYAWTRHGEYEKYSWMTEDEAKLYMFDVYDTDNDGEVTFAEGKAGYELEESRKNPFWSVWNHINSSYNWRVDIEMV